MRSDESAFRFTLDQSHIIKASESKVEHLAVFVSYSAAGLRLVTEGAVCSLRYLRICQKHVLISIAVIIDADSRNEVTDPFPNSFLFKMNKMSSPMCRCCLADVETVEHYLFIYPFFNCHRIQFKSIYSKVSKSLPPKLSQIPQHKSI